MIARDGNRIGVRVRGVIAPTFIERHAISPEDAIDYAPPPGAERAFDRLRDKHILREVAPGRFWFDLVAYAADTKAASRRAVPLAILAALTIAGLALLFYR